MTETECLALTGKNKTMKKQKNLFKEKKAKMKKNKIIALILSVLMLASCVPFVASAGEVDTGNGTEYEDGTTLITMDTMLKEDLFDDGTQALTGILNKEENYYLPAVEFNEGYDYTTANGAAATKATNGYFVLGEERGTHYKINNKYAAKSASKKIGTNTNLPLNDNTKYTISYEITPSANSLAQYNQANYVSLSFRQEASGNNINYGASNALLIHGPALKSNARMPLRWRTFTSAGANKGDLFEGVTGTPPTTVPNTAWKYTYDGADETAAMGPNQTKITDLTLFSNIKATKFDIEINGREISYYVNGVHASTYELQTSYSDNETLGLYLFNNCGFYAGSDCAPIFSMGNLVVKAGNVLGDSKVEFKDVDGNVVKTQYVTDGDIISEFPTVTASEGKAIKWFYEGTDILASAPYTVDGAAVLVAREVDTSTFTAVVGEQHTKPVDNKQDIRFLAVLDTTEGTDVGFKVSATYEGGAKEWYGDDTRTNTVYTSITASNAVDGGDGTENVTVKAEELGGKYIIAIAIHGVDTTVGEITFTVQSFITVGGEDQLSEPITFTFNGGERV